MDNKKLSDNEIIKALEDCFDKNEIVVSVYEPNDTKTDVTIQDVLDLINRQKAEIEMLQFECGRLERHTKMHDEIIAEAIKEFAERLKADLCNIPRVDHGGHVYYLVGKGAIDNLVKEMVGDTQ